MPKDIVEPTGQSQYVWDDRMAGPWCTEYRGSGVQPTMTCEPLSGIGVF